MPKENTPAAISNSPAKRRGRPPAPDTPEKQATIEAVLQHIADGLTLTEIEKLPGMPPRSTLNTWIAQNTHGTAERYAQAREVRADRIALEIFAIADNAPPEAAAVQKARLQVDARRWYLSKMMPEKYGDLQRLELSGRNGGAIGIRPAPPSIEDIIKLRREIDEAIKNDTE